MGERNECTLEAKIRNLSEQNAALKSARVDHDDMGDAMRKAIAAQSEGYISRVGRLEETKKNTRQDRVKLIEALAAAQARLGEHSVRMPALSEAEGRHARLDADHRALEWRSRRLREVNDALTSLLLGGSGSPLASSSVNSLEQDGDSAAAVAESLSRVLQLHARFVERNESHDEEKRKLGQRTIALERQNAQGGVAEEPVNIPTTKSKDKLSSERSRSSSDSGWVTSWLPNAGGGKNATTDAAGASAQGGTSLAAAAASAKASATAALNAGAAGAALKGGVGWLRGAAGV